MAEDPGDRMTEILAAIQGLGTRLDDLEMRAAEREAPVLHGAEIEDPVIQEEPVEPARDLHAQELHGRREAPDLHARELYGPQDGRGLHGVPEPRDLHGRRGARDLHGRREALNLHEPEFARGLHGARDARGLHGGRFAPNLHGQRRDRELPGERLEEDSDFEDEFPLPPPRQVRPRRRREFEDPLDHGRAAPRIQAPSLKLSAPTFAGKVDPEAYLDWERRMEHVFEVYDYEEYRKVQFAAAQLTDHALTWWDREQQLRRRNREGLVTTWEVMKFIMRRRYIPPMYHRELQKKFRKLTQGSRGVEEYYEEFEHLRNRLQLEDDEETLMAQFLDGLQERIVRKVERQTYHGFEELLHLAVQIETQVKRKSASMTRARLQAPSPAPWAPRTPAIGSSSRPFEKDKAASIDSRSKGSPTTPAKDTRAEVRFDPNNPRTRDIECFKCRGRGHYARDCPNQRVMILTSAGDIESQGEEKPQEEDSEDAENAELEYPETGDILVARRVLNTVVVPTKADQRDNIFYTRCLVSGKVCGIIVDGGSCTNVASTYLVEKLGLPLIKHVRPYKIRWFNDKNELSITDQVLVSFSIGRYSDQVLCDVVPMQASHLLLGRPWQFDREAIHNGKTNHYTILHDRKKYTLAPLLPAQIQELHVDITRNKAAAKSNFLIEPSDRRRALLEYSLPDLLMIVQGVFSAGTSFAKFPRVATDLMDRYKGLFREDIPTGLPPQREIEHHLEFVPGAIFPNRSPSQIFALESYEVSNQVVDSKEMECVWQHPSPCAVSLILFSFEFVCGSKLITPMNFITLLCEKIVSADGVSPMDYAQRLYEKLGGRLEYRLKGFAPQSNRDGTCREQEENGAYQSGPQGEFNIYPPFNVFNLVPFDTGTADHDLVLRSKPLQEGGNDEDSNHQLVPEVAEGGHRAKAKEQLGGSSEMDDRLIEDCFGICSFVGLSTHEGKSVWTLLRHGREEHGASTMH